MKKILLIVILSLFGYQAIAQCPTVCRPSGGGGDDEVVVVVDDPCAGCPSAQGEERKEPKATINISALEAMIKAKTPVTIVDARVGTMDDGKRIPGAIKLDKDSTKEEIEKAIPAKDSLIVVYCNNPQCLASSKLAAKLHELGYTNVLELPEGIEGWIAAGKTIEEKKK